MSRTLIVAATGMALLAGMGAASAQTVVVEEGYAPPVYVAPAPVYPAPVVVAPAPRVYVTPAPAYATPVFPPRRHTREVVVTEPAWDW